MNGVSSEGVQYTYDKPKVFEFRNESGSMLEFYNVAEI